MASGEYEKGFSKEVVSKLKTKRQVRICPAQAGGDPSRIDSTCKGLQANLLVHVVKHRQWEERCRISDLVM